MQKIIKRILIATLGVLLLVGCTSLGGVDKAITISFDLEHEELNSLFFGLDLAEDFQSSILTISFDDKSKQILKYSLEMELSQALIDEALEGGLETIKESLPEIDLQDIDVNEIKRLMNKRPIPIVKGIVIVGDFDYDKELIRVDIRPSKIRYNDIGEFIELSVEEFGLDTIGLGNIEMQSRQLLKEFQALDMDDVIEWVDSVNADFETPILIVNQMRTEKESF